MTSQIGAALSPLLVVPIQIRYGWRAPFFVFGFLGVVWSVVWYVWFRDSPHEKAGVTEAELRELRGFTEVALVLSSLTYVVGATANGLGGVVGDWMVKHHGLRNGRRWLGVAGLSVAAVSLVAVIFAPGGNLALVFLSLAYGGILFQQPTLSALCLDVGRKHAGAVFGFMNTAANAASAISAVVFGYLVGYFGNYDAPFVPMVALLAVGAVLWLQVDPTRELFPEGFVAAGQIGFEPPEPHAVVPAQAATGV